MLRIWKETSLYSAHGQWWACKRLCWGRIYEYGPTRECAEFHLRDAEDFLELTHRGPGWKLVWSCFGGPGGRAPWRPGAQLHCEGFRSGSVVKNMPARRECRFDPHVGKILWKKKWQPAPAFLSGKSHGQRVLLSMGHGELDMTSGWNTPTAALRWAGLHGPCCCVPDSSQRGRLWARGRLEGPGPGFSGLHWPFAHVLSSQWMSDGWMSEPD